MKDRNDDGARRNVFSDWRNFSLTGMMQNQGWTGTIVAIILGAVILYGINAIIYLTVEIFYTSDQVRAKLYQYFGLQNLITGVVVVLVTQVITRWLDLIPKVFLRYVVLNILVFVCTRVVGIGVYFLFGVQIVRNYLNKFPGEQAQYTPWYWYAAGPVIIANIFYYLSIQGKQISRKISDQEYRLLSLEKLKTRAELDALQARVNPHFLYNALNSIASLIHDNPEKAEEMTLLLSKLFRYTTSRNTTDYYDTIENELEMVQTYLEVEKVRFENRLKFKVEVSEPHLKTLRVPKFILQPIVENAIKHGISKRAERGAILVKIEEKDGWLLLSVCDNGPLFLEELGSGYGIRSIQDKLKLLYGDDAKLELRNEPKKAVVIGIKIHTIIKNQP